MAKKKKLKKEKIMNKEKVNFFNSLKGRIIISAFIALALAVTIVNVITLRRFDNTITSTTKNYMRDISFSYGRSIETEEKNMGDNALSPDSLSMQLKGAEVDGYKSSYAYLADKTGTMLYHPESDKIGQPVENPVVKDIVSRISAGETIKPNNKVVSYDFNGTKKYAAYYVPKDQSFILVVSADDSEVQAPVRNALISAIVAAVIVALVSIVILSIILLNSLKPIETLSDFVRRMAGLDLSSDEKSEGLSGRKDEIGVIARAITGLQKSLITIIHDIKNQSDKLLKASDEMYKYASNMNETTEQVDMAVGEIAQGATSQADQTQGASENVLSIGDMIEDADKRTTLLSDTAEKMKASGHTAVGILDELSETNERTRKSIDDISKQTRATNQSAGKIKEATTIISNIADETNLLSLNASIEAARAGDAGRGFSVVATQIQQLADQSATSAKQIEDIVEELISDSDKAVKIMDSVKEVIVQQSEDVERTKDAFADVSTGIEASLDAVSVISNKMTQMDTARRNVVDTVSSLSAIAEENAASTEECSASVSSITSIAESIEAASKELHEIADGLNSDIGKFSY